MAFLTGLLALPAAAGPVNWAHQAGAVQSNGSVIVKSLTGGSYSAVSNPTGSIVKFNQNAATQPPTIIVQKSGLPCYVGMSKEDRKTGCVLGADVFSDPEGRNKIGKYGGFNSVSTKKGSGTGTVGSFMVDFIVALGDTTGKYGCIYEGYEPVPAQGYPDLGSVMYLEGYNRPDGIDGGTYMTGTDWGLLMTSDFMYYYVTQGKCTSSGRTNSVVTGCAGKGKGWYVPSIKELNILRDKRDVFQGFTNAFYWSIQSSGNDGGSYKFDFSTGSSSYHQRNEIYRTRCLRVFNDLIRS